MVDELNISIEFAQTETWEGCRLTCIDPLVNVVPSDPTAHNFYMKKWSVQGEQKSCLGSYAFPNGPTTDQGLD